MSFSSALPVSLYELLNSERTTCIGSPFPNSPPCCHRIELKKRRSREPETSVEKIAVDIQSQKSCFSNQRNHKIGVLQAFAKNFTCPDHKEHSRDFAYHWLASGSLESFLEQMQWSLDMAKWTCLASNQDSQCSAVHSLCSDKSFKVYSAVCRLAVGCKSALGKVLRYLLCDAHNVEGSALEKLKSKLLKQCKELWSAMDSPTNSSVVNDSSSIGSEVDDLSISGTTSHEVELHEENHLYAAETSNDPIMYPILPSLSVQPRSTSSTSTGNKTRVTSPMNLDQMAIPRDGLTLGSSLSSASQGSRGASPSFIPYRQPSPNNGNDSIHETARFIRKTHRIPKKGGDNDTGHVYIVHGCPGLVKIGRSKEDIQGRRKSVQRCSGGSSTLYIASSESYTTTARHQLLEAIIHRSLSLKRQKHPCNCKSKRNGGCHAGDVNYHGEWFEIEPPEAEAFVECWRQWMRLTPYGKDDKLSSYWTTRLDYFQSTNERRLQLPSADKPIEYWTAFLNPSLSFRIWIWLDIFLFSPRGKEQSRWTSIQTKPGEITTRLLLVNVLAYELLRLLGCGSFLINLVAIPMSVLEILCII